MRYMNSRFSLHYITIGAFADSKRAAVAAETLNTWLTAENTLSSTQTSPAVASSLAHLSTVKPSSRVNTDIASTISQCNKLCVCSWDEILHCIGLAGDDGENYRGNLYYQRDDCDKAILGLR